jgi:hypothetical protein
VENKVQCPYCVSEIKEQALTCPHCAHDLYLVKTLQAKIAELEIQMQDIQQQFHASTKQEKKPEACYVEPDTTTFAGNLADWATLWLLPLVLLLIAHVLITVVFDVNLIYLRVMSLLIPLPFAFVLMLKRRLFIPWLIAAFIMAGLAVLGMSYVIYLVDDTPVLPQNVRDVREFIEYASSIGFSYLTGMILGNMLRQRNTLDVDGLIHTVVTVSSNGLDNIEKLQAKVQKLQKISGLITAATTTAVSIYNGFKIF